MNNRHGIDMKSRHGKYDLFNLNIQNSYRNNRIYVEDRTVVAAIGPGLGSCSGAWKREATDAPPKQRRPNHCITLNRAFETKPTRFALQKCYFT